MKRKKLPVENLARDIAQQPNEFTDAVFKGTATAYKLIIFAMYKAVDAPPEKDKPVIFSQNEFFERMGLSLGTNSYRIVDRAADELAESFLSFKNPRAKDPKDVYICKMPWFSRVEVTYERDLHLFFNPVISQFFDLRLGYTAIDLLEIGNLRSFYAMRYYGFAYKLICICTYSGESASWVHYTARILNNDRKYYYFSDTYVKEIKYENELYGNEPYLLFYKKIESDNIKYNRKEINIYKSII